MSNLSNTQFLFLKFSSSNLWVREVDEASRCCCGRIDHLDRRSNLTVKHAGWHQYLHGTVWYHIASLNGWPSLDNALVNSVQIYAGHVPSCVLNDPVDDMWSDVQWADMAKLAQRATTVWQRGKCCFSSFAYVFHLALQKIFDWSFVLFLVEPRKVAHCEYKRNSGSAVER